VEDGRRVDVRPTHWRAWGQAAGNRCLEGF
jgi:hypothetical protein